MCIEEYVVGYVLVILFLLIILSYPYFLIMFILSLFGVITPDGIYTVMALLGTIVVIETISSLSK